MQLARELGADVVIVGGGTGGCAAALAATAAGARVILTEETDWVGGQLTAQAVPPDEHRWIERFGCTRRYRAFREGVREFYRRHYPLSKAALGDPFLNPGGARVSRISHEFPIGWLVLQQMLTWPVDRGLLRVLLFRKPVAAAVDGDRVRSVTVRDQQTGHEETLTARYFLDATELGDLLPLTGTEYVRGAESQQDTGEPGAAAGPARPDDVEAITWCFAMGRDTAPGASHVIQRPEQYERWRAFVPATNLPWRSPLLSWNVLDPNTDEEIERPLFSPPGEEGQACDLWSYRRIVRADCFDPAHRPDEVTLVNWPQNDYLVRDPLDEPESEVRLIFHEARQLSLSLMYWMQTEAPRHDPGYGYPEMYLVPWLTGTDDGLAKYPYIREARRMRAVFTVTENHVSSEVRVKEPAEAFFDTVGVGHYNIDLHPSDVGIVQATRKTRPFQIPLGALLPVRVENLLPACKNIGVTHVTNGCYRLHPIEWNIGEAAGALAAFCLRRRICPRAVREEKRLLAEFQKMLADQGVELEWPPEVRMQS